MRRASVWAREGHFLKGAGGCRHGVGRWSSTDGLAGGGSVRFSPSSVKIQTKSTELGKRSKQLGKSTFSLEAPHGGLSIEYLNINRIQLRKQKSEIFLFKKKVKTKKLLRQPSSTRRTHSVARVFFAQRTQEQANYRPPLLGQFSFRATPSVCGWESGGPGTRCKEPKRL